MSDDLPPNVHETEDGFEVDIEAGWDGKTCPGHRPIPPPRRGLLGFLDRFTPLEKRLLPPSVVALVTPLAPLGVAGLAYLYWRRRQARKLRQAFAQIFKNARVVKPTMMAQTITGVAPMDLPTGLFDFKPQQYAIDPAKYAERKPRTP